MVEVQVDHATVVAANGTAATGLLDEDALDLLQPACDGLARAAPAPPTEPPVSPAVQVEHDPTVVWALPQLSGAHRRRRAPGLLHERDGWLGAL